MKSKKIISLLCASALTASSFAAFAVTANAEGETVLYSDTFNAQDTKYVLNGTNAPQHDGGTFYGLHLYTQQARAAGDRGWYVNSDDETVKTGSYYSVESKSATDKYLHMSYPIFGDFAKNGRWAYVDFLNSSKTTTAYTATAANDIVMDFDVKLTDGMIKGAREGTQNVGSEASPNNKDYDLWLNPILRIGTFDASKKTSNAVAIDKEAMEIGNDWVHARIIVNNTSGAKLYINGTEKGTFATVKSLDKIGLYFAEDADIGNMTPPLDASGQNSDPTKRTDEGGWLNASTPTKSPTADIDNVVIYSVAAGGATATSDAPTPETQDAGDKSLDPDVLAVAAPAVTIPDAATQVLSQNFNSANLGTDTYKVAMGGSSQTISTIDGVTVDIGGRTDGDNSTFIELADNTTNDKILRLTSGRFGNAGKRPMATLANNLPITSDTTTTSVMAFAAKLQNGGTSNGKLYLLDNSTNVDGKTNARDILAVLSTERDASGYSNGDKTIGVSVNADEWYTVVVAVSPNASGTAYGTNKVATRYRVYVYDKDGKNIAPRDGDNEATVVTNDRVNTGTTSVSVNNLPVISSSEDGDSIGAGNSRTVYIDNLVTYTTSSTEFTQGGVLPTVGSAVTEIPAVTVQYNSESNTVSLSNPSKLASNAFVIHAQYDAETHSVTNVAVKGAEFDEDGNATVYLKRQAAPGDKIFVWNSVGSVTPYCTAISIPALQ